RIENDVVVTLAGKAAERRALQRDPEGWLRVRTPAEVIALHEAAHAVLARALGHVVYELSVVPRPSVPVGQTFLAGVCRHGEQPQDISLPKDRFSNLETDSRRAAQYCMLLASQPMSWSSALKTARKLRDRARRLVDQHWLTISILAGA